PSVEIGPPARIARTTNGARGALSGGAVVTVAASNMGSRARLISKAPKARGSSTATSLEWQPPRKVERPKIFEVRPSAAPAARSLRVFSRPAASRATREHHPGLRPDSRVAG